MSKHTPGPWRIGRKVGRTIYCEEAGTEGRLIGVMDRPEDARLAGAAPQLLEALHEMTAAHQREDPHHVDVCTNCRLARAAIAKATEP